MTIQLLKFKGGTLHYYRTNIKGNEDITYDEAKRKMTRNMMLAHKEESIGKSTTMYKYGCLWFLVDNKDRIVWMRNNHRPAEGWKRNKREYLRLNKELGIDDDVTMTDLVIKDIKAKMKSIKIKMSKVRRKRVVTQ